MPASSSQNKSRKEHKMKWSMDHLLTWYFMTEFTLISQIYLQLLSLHTGNICTKFQVNSPSSYETCLAKQKPWAVQNMVQRKDVALPELKMY
jgi:hypothetical protein